MSDKRSVSGAASFDGDRWVQVRCRGTATWVRHVEFADQTAVRHRLASSGLLLASGEWKQLFEKVAKLTDFAPQAIIDRRGWNGQYFALPSGETFAPAGTASPPVVFMADPGKCLRAGHPIAWRRDVARPLSDHPVAAFVLMISFAAPLLALSGRIGNFGFALAGPGGIGKSTIQQLAASVWGCPTDGEGGHYWITLDSTAAGLTLALEAHADLPMILDEAALHARGSSQRARGAAMKDLAFQLASGHEKLKHGAPRPKSFRTIFLISTNQSLTDQASYEHAQTLAAAADRLITLPLEGRPSGVFERCPTGFESTAAFADSLVEAATRHHGTAIRRYLQKLVQHKADDELGLRRRIRYHIQNFCRLIGVAGDNGSEKRVAEAFGLVMAAGKLAQHYRVLPRNYDCEAIAIFCYRIHRAERTADASILSQLLEIASGPDVPWVDLGKLPNLTNAQLDQAGVFLHRNRSRRVELLFWPYAFQQRFSDWRNELRSPQLAGILNGDSDRPTVKRRIRSGRTDRVYCFILPGEPGHQP